jgi:hypothetical protein
MIKVELTAAIRKASTQNLETLLFACGRSVELPCTSKFNCAFTAGFVPPVSAH